MDHFYCRSMISRYFYFQFHSILSLMAGINYSVKKNASDTLIKINNDTRQTRELIVKLNKRLQSN